MSESRKRRQTPGLRNRVGSKENLQRNSGQQKCQNQTPRRMNSNSNSKSGFQRQGSHDTVRKIVQKEGREARNLITWSVPVEEQQAAGGKSRQPLTRYQPAGSQSPRQSSLNRHQMRPVRDRSNDTKKRLSSEMSDDWLRGSYSPKGTPKKCDIRARYWAFLFENLKRAVDEIYRTCETDESVVECKEVIMMLEQCTKDFNSLIERLNVIKAYETADDANKPTAIAWEVRKMSPGKNFVATQSSNEVPPVASPASRALDFSSTPSSQKLVLETSPIVVTGNSWADKVKGTTPPALNTISNILGVHPQTQPSPVEHVQQEEAVDRDGWETVQRNGRGRYRGSPAQGSVTGKKQSPSVSSSNVSSPSQGSLKPSPQRSNPASNKHIDNIHKQRQISEYSQKNHVMADEIEEEFLKQSESNRKRTYSRESEKENKPLIDKIEYPGGTVSKTTKSVDVTWAEKAANVSRYVDGDDEVTLEEVTMEADLDIESEDDKDEEELANQIEQALESVMDEEDSLTNELEEAQAQALEDVIYREENLQREIQREESMEVEPDPEQEGELETAESTLELSQPQPSDWDSLVERYEAEEQFRKTTSWSEMVEEAESRTPGRGFHMHEKLSSPSRKRVEDPSDTRLRYEKKQAKAQELRSKHLQEKAERLRLLTKKVEEVRAWKEELLKQQRTTILRKLQRAEQKRTRQLEMKRKKAHDEEAKANEIAFINSLEAQNKKHDIITKHQESEARLQDLQEERIRKHEEKLAKEAAAEERRKTLEAERVARLQEMQEKRREREREHEQKMIEREKDRVEQVRLKEKEREERVAALNAQQQEHIKSLVKKIRQKQDETSRRHNQNLDGIRLKAFEMSIRKHSTEDHNEAPKLLPYDFKKLCTVCNVLISSEVYLLSHLRGKKHQHTMRECNGGEPMSKPDIETFNLRHIIEAPTDKPDPQVTMDKERQKALKKRCKKLRQRMTSRGSEYETAIASKQQTADSEHKAKFQKIIKDLNKFVQSQDKGPWPQSRVSALDRSLGEMTRILEKKAAVDQVALRVCGGVTTMSRVMLILNNTSGDLPPTIPEKSIVHTCNVVRLICRSNYENCHYMLFSNKIMALVDLLIHQLNILIPDNFGLSLSSSGSGASLFRLPFDKISTALMQLLATVLLCLAKNNPTMNASEASAERMTGSGDAYMNRGNDIISYIVSVGVVDKLTNYFNNVRGPIDNEPEAADFLQHALGLLSSMTKFLAPRNMFESKKNDDVTQLIATIKATDLVGIVSMMYGMLLHSGAPSRGEAAPKELHQHTISVTLTAMKMLGNMACLNIEMTQASLGEEGISLQFRHIASYLLWYCSTQQNEELLHEVIVCVGYFTVLHQENQGIIQSGQPPTVLQQMCSLPFQYFSDPRLTVILFPTLIACCYENRRNTEILEQELSCALLANFVEEKQLEAQQAKLVSPSPAGKKTKERESEARSSLGSRFPVEEWDTARTYFTECVPPSPVPT